MDQITFPNNFYQGDTINCEDFFNDFQPKNGWTADYILLNNINKIVLENITVINADILLNKYIVNASTSLTETFDKGFYTLSAVFTNISLNKRITKTIKKIEIIENLTTATVKDDRIWAEIALENIQNYLKNKNNYSKSYEIAGRKLENYSFKELTDLVGYLKMEITREKGKKSKKGNGKIYIQFTRK